MERVTTIASAGQRRVVRSPPKNGADNVAVIEAPAPAQLIVGGLPTKALVADIVVSKYADHLPVT
jgi:transposase